MIGERQNVEFSNGKYQKIGIIMRREDYLHPPENWFSFALLLIEPTQSTTHGWVSTKTSRNSLKSLKRIFFQPIWLKGLSIGISRSPVMSAIPRSPFQTLLLTFILNYLTLALFLLSHKKGFANLLSVTVTASI
ncbi:hypothetical protein pdam_00016459 [Pocillopora damicornis]|uniref:Uncharacterized protein n=1 Tax=Pocillopora damicornis TaxID=46731 RepID=A0A3M6TR72_POCDA|nr:hypothetical protein pdam_00016459 [Pocillopora damicornis]